MTNATHRLIHATKTNPCPICGNTDWCYELSDTLWGCKRSDSAPPGWRKTKKQDREGHWLFALDGGNAEFGQNSTLRLKAAACIACEELN